MNKYFSKYLFIILTILSSVVSPVYALTDTMQTRISDFVQRRMKNAAIPGLAIIVIDNGQKILEKGYGWADIEGKRAVTLHTRFEIGSNTKAFTALGILYLEQQGLLKLSDPVQKYLPWLVVKYGDEPHQQITPVITLGELLYHTSGIPFHSIDLIKPGSGPQELETTVRKLIGIKLDHLPGERHKYATINYDVLGLVIQQISGQSYEAFIQSHILSVLGMQHTSLFRTDAGADIATGYKFGYLQRQAFTAPVYRGNTPAGYILSDISDMGTWLTLQLKGSRDSFLNTLINRSHEPDRSVRPQPDGTSYGAGWYVHQGDGGKIVHGGNNPNYSSSMVFSRIQQKGVVVLANINSAATENIAQGVLDILSGKAPLPEDHDFYKNLDIMGVVLLGLSLVFIGFTCWHLLRFTRELSAGQRARVSFTAPRVIGGLMPALLLLGCMAYCLYLIPSAMFDQLTWAFVDVWGPASFLPSLKVLYGGIIFFFIYYCCISFYTKQNDRGMYPVIILSLISGLGNTLIIFVINEGIGRKNIFASGFVLYFLLGLILYIYSQRELRGKLIHLVNSLVYSARVKLIHDLLNTPYQKIERMKKENILTVLNNDTETVSNFPHVLVGVVTGMITLICCFIYLAFVNLWGLAISVFTIVAAAGIYYYVSGAAGKVWEETRDLKNVYIRFIYDLMDGLKELKLNIVKNRAFEEDIKDNSSRYRDKNTLGGLKFANVFVVGELIFTMVIGAVVFIFPLVLIGLEQDKIRVFVFVFLYMTGPVNIVLNAFPQLTLIKISWKRIGALRSEISSKVVDDGRVISAPALPVEQLSLSDVSYRYKNAGSGVVFDIGPINYTFRSSEVVFITGGNGSGKSTLARILCGLYEPDNGVITVNGEVMDSDSLGQLYTTIFSDYHLFDKLYGVDCNSKTSLISEKMAVLQLGEKTSIKDGRFTSIALSTGQRKRLALLVSYLEDKAVCLFDEWAADQDPEFKRFFYEELLMELKGQGKIVIVISHDDRYFHVADRIIKMESGRLIQLESFSM